MSYKFFFFACALNLFYYVPNLLASPVIGGQPDTLNTYKYHVSILFRYKHEVPNSGELLCGGTIIHDRYVLSAARCFMKKTSGRVEKVLQLRTSGVVVLAGTSETYGAGIMKSVLNVFIPLAYNQGKEIFGNIAVVKLADGLNVEQNGNILQILPLDPGRSFNDYRNKKALVLGNGCDVLQRGDDGVLRPQPNRVAQKRQVLEVLMLQRSVCPLHFDHSICAVNLDQSQIRSCSFGDGGSPLVYEDTLIGVLSQAPSFFQNNRKGMIFTRVLPFIRFIRNAMNEHGDHSKMYTLDH